MLETLTSTLPTRELWLRKLRKRPGHRAARLWLLRSLNEKWEQDCKHLPLTDEHRDLYDINHILCWRRLGELPNLVDCRDYNDKIQWLKLFDQRCETVRCSDKIEVRGFVCERVGQEHLVELYQTGEQMSEIDFQALPESFVIKTNHDSGTVILVRDKNQFDYRAAKEQIRRSLAKTYGWRTGEWAYSMVKPRVLVEEYIGLESTKQPPDFKFHCVDGKVKWLQYIFDRGIGTKEVITHDDGAVTPLHFDHNMTHSESFERPAQWTELKKIAEALSQGFKYVRVDLYLQRDRIFVGELTFFPLSGCYRGPGQWALGRLLDFDRSTFKPLTLGQGALR